MYRSSGVQSWVGSSQPQVTVLRSSNTSTRRLRRGDADGPLAIVGAPRDAGGGSAYVVDVATGNALFELQDPNGQTSANSFGGVVRISGERAIVADALFDQDKGRAWIFDTATGLGLFELSASNAEPGAFFASALDIDGARTVLGAPHHGSTNSGLAYVFDVETGAELRMLSPQDAASGDRFGAAVALWQGRALIAAPAKAGSTGAVYVFDVETGEQLAKLTASDAAPGAEFGHSLAFDGGRALIGSWPLDTIYVFDALAGTELFQIPNPGSYEILGIDLALAWGGGEHTAVATAEFLFETVTLVFDAATGAWVDELVVVELDDLGKLPSNASVAVENGRIYMGVELGEYVNVQRRPDRARAARLLRAEAELGRLCRRDRDLVERPAPLGSRRLLRDRQRGPGPAGRPRVRKPLGPGRDSRSPAERSSAAVVEAKHDAPTPGVILLGLHYMARRTAR